MKFSLFDRVLGTQAPPPDGSPVTAYRDYRLGSATPGAFFSATIQAQWLSIRMGCESQIFQYLWNQGKAVTSHFSVLDATAANDALNASFAVRRVIPGSDIQLVYARATLNVAENDRDFAERKADIERRASIQIADLEAKYAYLIRLRDLFLSDAAMTGLWWSNGDPDRVLRLAEPAVGFDTIVRKIAGSPNAPGQQQDKIASLIGCFLTSLGPDHREYLIGQLAKIFESYQQPDLVPYQATFARATTRRSRSS